LSLELSRDGSHTLYSDKYDSHYHSIYGAIDESIHVFISAGLYYQYRKGLRSVTIFEMGLGTGLNAYLTLLEAQKLGIQVKYISVETDPITIDKAKELNYAKIIDVGSQMSFDKIHNSPWATQTKLSDNFTLEKHNTSIQNFTFDHSIDIIYFDAFAPSSQPELWESDIHKELYEALKTSGILVTYCAKGSFKRMLKDTGYKLDMLNGPHKKREMTRAIKI
jgi:tRNA U34 5-methylaminomethyl-2-thiouridine-forming methyltransferase MnmC